MASQGAIQAARAVVEAGFPRPTRATAVAVAGAESGWRTSAKADRCGGAAGPCNLACGGLCSYGPWQINLCAHAPLMRQLTGRDSPCYWAAWLEHYDTSARAAYHVSLGGKDWTPWTTYRTGAYRHYLSEAEAALQAAGNPASAPAPAPASVRIPSWVLAATIGVPLLLALTSD